MSLLGGALFALWIAVSPWGLANALEVVWDPNPPGEKVAGYLVVFGDVSRHAPRFTSYPHEVDVGPALRCDLARLNAYPGAAYLSIVAYNEYGMRSDFSEELSLRGEGAGGGGGGGCFLETLRRRGGAR